MGMGGQTPGDYMAVTSGKYSWHCTWPGGGARVFLLSSSASFSATSEYSDPIDGIFYAGAMGGDASDGNDDNPIPSNAQFTQSETSSGSKLMPETGGSADLSRGVFAWAEATCPPCPAYGENEGGVDVNASASCADVTPKVAITGPGHSVPVNTDQTVTAAADASIAGIAVLYEVDFKVDGKGIGSWNPFMGAVGVPCSALWRKNEVTEGLHTLSATAHYTGGGAVDSDAYIVDAAPYAQKVSHGTVLVSRPGRLPDIECCHDLIMFNGDTEDSIGFWPNPTFVIAGPGDFHDPDIGALDEQASVECTDADRYFVHYLRAEIAASQARHPWWILGVYQCIEWADDMWGRAQFDLKILGDPGNYPCPPF